MPLMISTGENKPISIEFISHDPEYLNSIKEIHVYNKVNNVEQLFIDALKHIKLVLFRDFLFSSSNLPFLLSIFKNNSIESLNLIGCTINPDCIDTLKNFIENYNYDQLEINNITNFENTLDALQKNNSISRFKFISKINLPHQAFSEILKNNKKLKEFLLSDINFDDPSCEVFYGRLKENTTLKILTIKNTTLTHKSVQFFSAALKEHKSIADITLETVKIEHNSIEALSMIAENKFLQFLRLISVEIGSVGAINVSSALTQNTFLKVLEMSNAGVSDQAVDSICYLIAHNRTLETLDLSNNSFNANSIIKIFKALKSSKSIYQIFLENASNEDSICTEENLDNIINYIKTNLNLTLVIIEGIVGQSQNINSILCNKLNLAFDKSSYVCVDYKDGFELLLSTNEDKAETTFLRYQQIQTYIETKTNAILKLIKKSIEQIFKSENTKTPMELNSKEFFILTEKDKQFVELHFKRFTANPNQEIKKINFARNKNLLKSKTFCTKKIECADVNFVSKLDNLKSEADETEHILKKPKISYKILKEFYYFPQLPFDLQCEVMGHVPMLTSDANSFEMDYAKL